MKQKRIRFEFRPNATEALRLGKPYRCLSVTDSTETNPGDWFDRKEVDSFCMARNWTVTIVAEDVN